VCAEAASLRHRQTSNVERLLIGSSALLLIRCPTASSPRGPHTVGLNTRQVFVLARSIQFSKNRLAGGCFAPPNRALAVVRRTYPEYRTPAALSTSFFRYPPAPIARQERPPVATGIETACAVRCCVPRLPRATKGSPDWVAGYQAHRRHSQLSASPPPDIQAARPRCVVMPVRPARLSRLARSARGVNP